ncbi:MAG: phosphoadenosine phosphosulfate reductase [Sulfurimonas sp. RIFOXYD12_FULL_33_39]|uniref:phosphoadenylyl-sulfate reductase n=1 Tax=unclassified Sulfurimonas TaxID=2623549 RepID=UPI0008D60379|nr:MULTISPECIES: phosphoadenylyl-sulfate reductase [unclassified Sulfurimonas]OHE07704.1 MAG: phosphoadenosine phosphosulfate reductase [Sulfurimonas sp. RIFCSPLOWO2_12_FULL_34_6]OHE10731.1 MAG: phosphoadenosine phosphosulfate reductase [Sulfurimonas sp. RIFOXYD12_FULL_33_39]OHE13499.1 MAG: phosphoadenosine phosphosulfate reductase [Sulfurimonas sp. RIFOXYD2_FULL_34_21]
MKETIKKLNEKFKDTSLEELLEYFLKEYRGRIALSSSFGSEDQVLTDTICKLDKKAKIFTLDTGRLPQSTYDVMERTNLKYNTKIKVYFPKSSDVEKLYKKQGINGFYESIENRKECCYVRKIAPLKRALKGVDLWITGLRAQQSPTREDMYLCEWDEGNNLIKLNPLILWSEQEVWDYIKKNKVPYNALHDKGYPSIGCAPCSRAVKDGEDIRSGRWWWENPEHKECGLHKQ